MKSDSGTFKGVHGSASDRHNGLVARRAYHAHLGRLPFIKPQGQGIYRRDKQMVLKDVVIAIRDSRAVYWRLHRRGY